MKSLFFYLLLVLIASAAGLLLYKDRIETKTIASTGAAKVSYFTVLEEGQNPSPEGEGPSSNSPDQAHIWQFAAREKSELAGSESDQPEETSEGDSAAVEPSSPKAKADPVGAEAVNPLTPAPSSTIARVTPPEEVGLPKPTPAAPGKKTEISYTRNGNVVTLSGVVPRESDRLALRRAVGDGDSIDLKLDENIRVDEKIEPTQWLGELPKLLNGQVGDIAEAKFSIGADIGEFRAGPGTDLSDIQGRLEQWGKNNGLKKMTVSASPATATSPQPSEDPPAEKRESLSLFRKGNTLVLDGAVASQDRKNAISSAVGKIAGLKVENHLTIDPSVKMPEWSARLPQLLPDFFARVPNGSVVETGEGILLAGKTSPGADPAELSKLAARLLGDPGRVTSELTKGETLKSNARDATLVVEHLAGKTCHLSGDIPAGQLGENLIAIASRSVDSGVKIDNDLKSAKDVKRASWILPAAEFLPDFLAYSRSGKVSLGDRKAALEAVYETPAEKKALEDGFNKAFAGIKGRTMNLKAVPGTEVTQSVDTALRDLAVYFDSNSDEVKASERGKVAEAATAIKRLGGKAKLIVGGHADSTGNADYNRALSIRRAGAVRAILVQLGVPEARMELQSFGADGAPVAAGPEADRLSRRVEIRIAQ